jgi:hypothetical protein
MGRSVGHQAGGLALTSRRASPTTHPPAKKAPHSAYLGGYPAPYPPRWLPSRRSSFPLGKRPHRPDAGCPVPGLGVVRPPSPAPPTRPLSGGPCPGPRAAPCVIAIFASGSWKGRDDHGTHVTGDPAFDARGWTPGPHRGLAPGARTTQPGQAHGARSRQVRGRILMCPPPERDFRDRTP